MKKKEFNCPAEMAISLIDGKWRAILIYNLRKGARRFGELKRLSPGITPTTLIKALRDLEDSGLVKRIKTLDGSLPSVEYSLTDRGESLKPVLYALIRWGLANQKDYATGEFGMAIFQK